MNQAKLRPSRRSHSMLDYLLYAVAGGVFLSIGFSFLLWLRF